MGTQPPSSEYARYLAGLPPRDADDDAWRAPRVREAQFLAFIITLPLAIAFFVIGRHELAVVVALFAGVSGVQYVRLRRGAKSEPVARLTLGIALFGFYVGSRTDAVFDPMSVTWMGLVPMIAASMLRTRETWWWLGAAVGTGALAWLQGHHAGPGETPDLRTMELRSLGFGVTVLVIAWRLEIERRKAMMALVDADRLKRRFLANVSHEIRTPMNGLLGMTELLLKAPEHAPPDSLQVIHRSGQTLLALVNDLLDLSKMEAGRLAVTPAPCDVRTLVNDLGQLFLPAADGKGLQLRTLVAPALPGLVLVDPLRLRQVLANLLGNAVKFTAQGEVLLSVIQVDQGAWRFEVRDTGPGIAADVLPRLFLSFEQGNADTTRRFGGTGLGPALPRELVSLMGGSLEVDTAPGRGARFWFDLSLPSAQAGAAATPLQPLVVTDLTPARPFAVPRRQRVLVVDDNVVNARVACAMLERLGALVEVAGDGRAGVEALTATHYDLVLMDCHMPVMDGFEAAKAMRALPAPRGQTRIIALTASAMPEELAQCRASGMDDVLAKPVSLAALTKLLNEL